MTKTYIKEAVEVLGISRSTLYSRLKKLGIAPLKAGNNSYLSNEDLDRLEKYNPTEHKKDGENIRIEELRASIKEKSKEMKFLIGKAEKWKAIAKTLEEQNDEIHHIKATNKNQREKIENLNREVGQWQGRAKTLEEQYEKLLVLEAPQKPKKKWFFRRFFK